MLNPSRRSVPLLVVLAAVAAACGPTAASPSPSVSAPPASASPGVSGAPSASAGPSEPGENGPIGNLDGTGWRVLQVGDVVPEAGSEPTIVFRGGEILGSTGCNEFGGPVTLSGLTIDVGDVTQTLRLCEGPVGAMETAFVTALNDAEELVVQGANLLIRGPGGEILLRPDATVGG
jgi:heat shock protein HslJ